MSLLPGLPTDLATLEQQRDEVVTALLTSFEETHANRGTVHEEYYKSKQNSRESLLRGLIHQIDTILGRV